MEASANKVLLLGNAGVGKTALMTRIVSDVFRPGYEATAGASFNTVAVDTGSGTDVPITLWDTAGQERYRSLVPQYYRGARAALLLFDLSDEETIDGVEHFANDLFCYCTFPDAPLLFVVGNKYDLQHTVNYDVGQEMAEKFGAVMYCEVSALTGYGVWELMMEVARAVARASETRTYDEERIDAPVEERERKRCCGS